MTDNMDNIVENEEVEVKDEEEKTYTLEEVQNLIQSEADKRVTQALKTQKAKFDKELSKQKTLSELDGEARNLKEKDMRIQELEAKLTEFNILQNKAEVTKTLSARGLDPSFADIITIGDDLSEAQANIESLDKLFKAAVAKEVKNRLGEGSSSINTGNSRENMTKDDFNNLTIQQQAEIYKSNPELYKKLSR